MMDLSDVPALSSPPWLSIPGIPNLRQPLSTFPLLRCAAPTALFTPSSHARLAATGVSHIFDLRSTSEITALSAEQPIPPPIVGITRTHVPVHTAAVAHDAAAHWRRILSGDLVTGSINMLEEGRGGGAFAPIFRAVERGEGVVVHCTLGKDRTGVICALLLKLAGWTDEAVAEDYMLTELGMGVGGLRDMLEKRLLEMEAVKELPDDMRAAGVQAVLGAKKETMLTILERLEGMGGAEKYAQSCGFTTEEVERMGRNLRGET
ncbi:protein-tyrosine phosphatase-like protein [Geopyxis carbonaria]|nr:protein-tyrosine phosphatase-like protein [Geopyxis carbonaria]